MKLQVSFDLSSLENALEIASEVAEYTDILEVGTLLIYNHGIAAVSQFKEKFEHKTILADSKIVDNAKDAAALFARAGADWITVLAGTDRNIIHAACSSANELNKKIMLDLIDAPAIGQSALEASKMGVNALLYHHIPDTKSTLSETWEIIRGNTDLPIFVSGKITKETIDEILLLKPDGIVIGKSILSMENPAQEVRLLREKIDMFNT